MLVKSQVKYIQSLGQKKSRNEASEFIAEGPKIVKELLAEIPGQVMQVYALQEWIDAQPALPANNLYTVISPVELEQISQLKTPNQVLALVKKFDSPAPVTSGVLTLVLDTVQDPGNLGTIIRIADWFGIRQVVCSADSADLYNPKLVQSTMASIARVQVYYTDLPGWLSQQPDLPIYATVLNGQPVQDVGHISEGLIIIGNESKGISEKVLKYVTAAITIQRKGRAESLNAAVAAGIVLSHLVGGG